MKKKNEKKKNEKENKNLILIIAIVCAIIVFIIGIYFIVSKLNIQNQEKSSKTNEQKIKYNKNENVIKDKNIGGILFTNIECSFDGNMSLISYTIVNHTSETINLKEYEVMVKDKTGNVITTIAPNLDIDIEPEKSFDTGNAVDIDLSEAYSMELVLDSNTNDVSQ